MKACVPYVGMLIVQLAYCGSNILCKLALENGLSYLVFIVYRHLIAMVLLAPLAYLLERKKRHSLSLAILSKIFILALFGTTIHQNLYYAGLDYTSPTVASALASVIPVFTFILATLLRMERISIKSKKGRAKLLGTTVCISGALIFTFWKGHQFRGFVDKPLIIVNGNVQAHEAVHERHDWIKGSVLILTSFIAFSVWLILQGIVYKVYPAGLSLNTIICFFASLQSSVLALIFERNSSSWRLGWNIQLVTIIYCGTFISCLAYYLQTICVHVKGPVFVALFMPLLLVIVGVFSAVCFAERLHLGSLIGAFMIISGLYCYLWGKNRDTVKDEEDKDGEEQVEMFSEISLQTQS
ncbi:putative EamA domain-containing protein [Dioscorea sansibarensis]